MTAVFAVVMAPAIVAHEGGWDEALLIGVPILIIIALLWLAKRRVDAAQQTSPGGGSNEPKSDANHQI